MGSSQILKIIERVIMGKKVGKNENGNEERRKNRTKENTTKSEEDSLRGYAIQESI